MSSNNFCSNVGFIGGGNMATAIAEGAVKKGTINYAQVYVSGPRLETLEPWRKNGANVTTDNQEVVAKCEIIFVCVKPHILPIVVQSLQKLSTFTRELQNKLFISILAGVQLETLEQLLNIPGARVIRTMPNTPMMVGEGCTVYCLGKNATEVDKQMLEALLTGIIQEVPEPMINSVGALAGSGPAYVYLMIEALSDGGVKMGIPRAMATKFAAQTLLGAAKMVLETGKHPGTLKDEVCSPGGSSIAGVHALEAGGVRAALMNAVEAATKKNIELGNVKK